MKLKAEKIRSHLLHSLLDATILVTAAIFSVAVGFLIAAPLWAFATSAPVLYSRLCLATVLLLFFILWIRKMIFLKRKTGVSPGRQIAVFLCRTFSFLLAAMAVLALYWQLPIACAVCVLLLLLLRLPLFLTGADL